jgi:hypothetical protein
MLEANFTLFDPLILESSPRKQLAALRSKRRGMLEANFTLCDPLIPYVGVFRVIADYASDHRPLKVSKLQIFRRCPLQYVCVILKIMNKGFIKFQV